MSNPAPTNPNVPSQDPAKPAGSTPIVPPFEERLRQWWVKNGKSVYVVVIVVLLSILGKGGWEYYQQEQEKGIQADFARASTPEKLKAFISQHPTHSLSGVASLRLGDDAYSAGNYVDAQANYQRAADVLKAGPFAGRARLGLAVSKIAGGQKAEGEEKLKQLANDVAALKPVRAEAAYHFATLAVESGRTEEAARYLDLASTVDQGGLWSQRAMMLRATLPVPAAAAPAPEVSVKPAPKP